MLKLKDIIALGLLALVSFPIVLLGVLLWTGNVRLVFGPESHDPNARARLLERPEDIPGATSAQSVGHDSAGVSGKSKASSGELDQREAEVLRETQRMEELRFEDARLRDTIHAERERLEKILSHGDSLENQRTTVLAATFVGMKPDQAAKILSALDDVLVTAILRKVAEDKSRAKILAAMSKTDVQRAASVTRLLESNRGLSDLPAAKPTPKSTPTPPKPDTASAASASSPKKP